MKNPTSFTTKKDNSVLSTAAAMTWNLEETSLSKPTVICHPIQHIRLQLLSVLLTAFPEARNRVKTLRIEKGTHLQREKPA